MWVHLIHFEQKLRTLRSCQRLRLDQIHIDDVVIDGVDHFHQLCVVLAITFSLNTLQCMTEIMKKMI